MIYVYKDRIINIEWTILKGTSNVKENFDRALVKLFLIGPHEKYLLQANTKDGVVSAEIPQGFPEGVYSVELIYIKNWLGVDRPPKISDRYPIDCRGNSRCIMRSRKDYLFAITEYESEATNIGDGEVVIRLKTSTASYGYDGLSAYEIAVMRGDFNGSEEEWLDWLAAGKIQVDSSLSESSKNPVENRVMTKALSQKQAQLVSGENIKTINGQTILGKGNIAITGNIVNNPDDEDLISKEKPEGTRVLKLADKAYNASAFSGLGRVYLRKNVTASKNILTQAMISNANTRYVIQYDYDLNGQAITIPEGCVLDFQGGSLSNGKIYGKFKINNDSCRQIFNNIQFNFLQPFLYPEWFGAKGDGITDDTEAIQEAIKYSECCYFRDRYSYKVNTTITVLRNHSIYGNGAKIFTSSSFIGNSFGNDVPEKTILYLETADGSSSGFDKAMRGATIKDLRIFGSQQEVGLYIGYTNKSTILSSSNVNYSVYGYIIDNLYIDSCDVGCLLTDCWDTNFNNLNINASKTNAVKISGQVVNCTFNMCKLYGGDQVLRISAYTYGSGMHRPEGCSFNGGFIGYGNVGISEVNSLAFYFNNVIIDLNSNYAIQLLDATGMIINSCWVFSSGNYPTIKIEPISTDINNTVVTIRDCYISRTTSGSNIDVGYNRNGISILNNTFSQHPISISSDCFIVIKENMWLGATAATNMITINTRTIVRSSGNVFKRTGNPVLTNIPANSNLAGSDLPVANDIKSGVASSKMFSETSRILVEIPVSTTGKYYDLFEITDTYHATVFLSMGFLAHDFLNVIVRCSNNIDNIFADGLNKTFDWYPRDFTLHYYKDTNEHVHVVYHPISTGSHGVYGRLLANGNGITIFNSNKDISDNIASGEIKLTSLDIMRIDGANYNIS